MGIFHEQVELVNRTAGKLEIMYDGQRVYLAPNYTVDGERIPGVVNLVPKQVVPNALNQTVVMGSEKAKDPSNFESKVGLVPKPEQIKAAAERGKKLKPWNNCEFLDDRKNTEISRVSRAELMDELVLDPTAKLVVKGKIQRDEDFVTSRSIFDVVPG